MSEAVTIAAPVSEAGADAVETASEAAVVIAQIEADRDVRIAEIHAETTETVVEAQTDLQDDVEWLEGRLGAFEASVSALVQNNSSMLAERLTIMEAQHVQMLEMMTALLILIPPAREVTPEVIPETPTPETPTPETPGAEESEGAQRERERLIRRWV